MRLGKSFVACSSSDQYSSLLSIVNGVIIMSVVKRESVISN